MPDSAPPVVTFRGKVVRYSPRRGITRGEWLTVLFPLSVAALTAVVYWARR